MSRTRKTRDHRKDDTVVVLVPVRVRVKRKGDKHE